MLRIQVLGPLRVELDGRSVELPDRRQRVCALLAWLAVHPGPHHRSRLAGEFWPEVPEANARASLRSAVWALRAALGPAGVCLEADRDTVRLGGDPWVDLAEFDRLAASGDCVAAVDLCRGELLAGWHEDWVLELRTEHARRLAAALGDLAARAEAGIRTGPVTGTRDESGTETEPGAEGSVRAAIGWARRRVDLDPANECAGRELIRLLCLAGDEQGAIAAYARLRRALSTELDLRPSAETTALIHRLRPHEPVLAPWTTPVQPRPEFIGRARELERLRKCLARTETGLGLVATITGEGGIGKTALTEEILDAAAHHGARTAGGAAGGPGGMPFEVWSGLLTDLLAATGPLPSDAPWAADLARLVPAVAPRAPAVGPEHDRIRLFEAVIALLGTLSARHPLALALEDLHLADPSSLDLLGYVTRRITRLPILFVLTRRRLPPSPRAEAVLGALRAKGALAAEIELGPMDSAEIRALAQLTAARTATGMPAAHTRVESIAATGPAETTAYRTPTEPATVIAVAELSSAPDPAERGGALSPAQLAGVVAVAGGSPLLAVAAARQFVLGNEGFATDLRAATRAELARLSGSARLFVELVAVAGHDVGRAEIVRLPALGDADRAATEALGSGLLRIREGAIGFRHERLRVAVYEDIAEPLRARMHEDLAAALRVRGVPGTRRAAEIAGHLRKAGRDDLAVGHLVHAAAEARAMAALAEAAGFLREALEVEPDNPDALIELGEVEAWRGRLDASDAAFDRALRLLSPQDTGALVAAWLRRGMWLRGGICHPRESRRSYRAALDLLEREPDPDPTIRAAVLAGLAWAESVAGDPGAVAELLRAVGELTEGRAIGDLLSHDVEIARAHALLRAGRFTESFGPLLDAAAAADRAGRPDLAYSCLINAAGAAACAGKFERALDFADRCLSLVVPNDLLRLVVYTQSGRCALLLRLDRMPEARAALDGAAAAAERLGSADLAGLVLHDRGLLAQACGDPDEAIAQFRRALNSDAPISRALTRLRCAEMLTRTGDLTAAEKELREVALEPVTAGDFPDLLVARMQRIQGLIALARDDRGLAVTRLRQAKRAWRRRVDAGSLTGERYSAAIVDLGRPPLAAFVEPERELALVLADLSSFDAAGSDHAELR
ncbi:MULTISPECIES: AAA family ATPase [unclassified Nocardia]|uniref:AAA family ATPase n=1 Tax=unclassified Nocardia TaxID=2637762 RepID=UPI00278C360D|nr:MULTISPECIES: AAA family ATPase [unclassified Nocardia]